MTNVGALGLRIYVKCEKLKENTWRQEWRNRANAESRSKIVSHVLWHLDSTEHNWEILNQQSSTSIQTPGEGSDFSGKSV